MFGATRHAQVGEALFTQGCRLLLVQQLYSKSRVGTARRLRGTKERIQILSSHVTRGQCRLPDSKCLPRKAGTESQVRAPCQITPGGGVSWLGEDAARILLVR